MKDVLISLQPKWCDLVALGEKTAEVRKTRPKIKPPFKVYIYETKGKKRKYTCRNLTSLDDDKKVYCEYDGIGAVIGEFICNRIDDYHRFMIEDKDIRNKYEEKIVKDIESKACITLDYLRQYTSNLAHYDKFYIWHISNLVIYEKPKMLYDFVNYNKHEVCLQKNCFSGDCWGCPNNAIMVLPPQSWCYVKAIPDIPN